MVKSYKSLYRQHNIVLDGERGVVSNIFCIGRNYREHAAGLGNAVPEERLVFLKPRAHCGGRMRPSRCRRTAARCITDAGRCRIIGRTVQSAAEAGVSCIAGIGVGLDLTARDVQGRPRPKVSATAPACRNCLRPPRCPHTTVSRSA